MVGGLRVGSAGKEHRGGEGREESGALHGETPVAALGFSPASADVG
jgi:hypothetical protein